MSGAKRTLLITIAYDGRNYHGFQVQKNAASVAEVFQDAVEAVFKKRHPIKGCSRTDSGVHANMFCISMEVENPIPCEKVIPALNIKLPPDVSVLDCREVPEGFHARYDCEGKEYVYRILNRIPKDPFSHGLALHHPYRLDLERMNRACQGFLGTHDYSAFCSVGCDVEDHVRTIHWAKVEREGDFVIFRVAGDGFLYNMVRIMVGTLLAVSRGAIEPEDIPDIIASRDRSRAGMTALPCGLYLNRVFYEWDKPW